VPYAIDEADTLYRQHMHVSLALFQMWKTREACLLDESGIDPDSPQGMALLETESAAVFGSVGPKPYSKSKSADEEATDPESALPDVRKLDAAIVETQQALDKAEADGDRAARRRLKERRDDLVRLRRVESLYVRFTAILWPDSSSPWVVIRPMRFRRSAHGCWLSFA
jgi:hypothetical protein